MLDILKHKEALFLGAKALGLQLELACGGFCWFTDVMGRHLMPESPPCRVAGPIRQERGHFI